MTYDAKEPLYLKPLMMERVWGGNRLGAMFGKSIPAGKVIGESWELSDRPEAQSIIDGGAFDGKTLRQILESYPAEILGNLSANPKSKIQNPKSAAFPLLIKYVDAGAPLSVQVHPDDQGAQAFGDRGKSECWLIVHAEPGAEIVRGLKKGTTRQAYERAVAEDRVKDVLHSFTPKAGDMLALPPGMVHAIGAGLVVAEIQQNSDLTFRIYDYKRPGLDGKLRQLHVKEALAAIRFGAAGDEFAGDMSADTVSPLTATESGGARVELMLQGRYFNVMRYTVRGGGKVKLPEHSDAPRVLMAVAGNGRLGERALGAGQTVLVPAMAAELELRAGDKGMVVLVSVPAAMA